MNAYTRSRINRTSSVEIAMDGLKRPKHSYRLLALAFLCFAGQLVHVAFAADDEQELARSILDQSDQIRFPRDGFQVDVKIETNVPGQPPEFRKYRVLSRGNENTVVMVTEPASERGQIMLMKGRD